MSVSDIALSVRGLSKAYTIARNAGEQHVTLAEATLARLRRPFRRAERETFWALKDVSFDIKRGDVVGIIGRNGAGKSTLLKVLSRITEPTTGEIDVYGRIGSLLEVGTGFHPELTGRENIFLNGAILGMSKAEIRKQFDAIVDFAGVERFLDTPVKRYSSGMYVRLAFAVAAHLESEILIVDEVLAVGDGDFQQKCLGKMREVAATGERTVLFVSHNISAVQSLCTQAVLLENGALTLQGDTAAILEHYQNRVLRSSRGHFLDQTKNRTGNGTVRLCSFHLESLEGAKLDSPRAGGDVVFCFGYQTRDGKPFHGPVDVGFSISTLNQHMLFVLYSSYTGRTFNYLPAKGVVRCTVKALALAAGHYTVGARVFANGIESDWPRDPVAQIEVVAGDFYGTGSKGFQGGTPMMVGGVWESSEVEAEDNELQDAHATTAR